ncbi:dTMP kinase [Paludisphaera rhizosphaerae]|uniref:dTMP kinase n=1 Tax=Paludisphaera rhizosphaerae TaxID=2711216 RepID=UPI001F0E6766|nr:dTMP kinase [Paludisphaera rhizosphaerae]
MTHKDTVDDTTRLRPHPGFFLVFEGPDGGGKSTQAARTIEWLREEGFDVVACRDPGGTNLGERLRTVILSDESVHPTMRAEMLLYMASRAQLVDEVIRPALAAGRIVVSDRFVLSNIIYQGVAGGLSVDEIADVGLVATGGLMPDLTLLLDVPQEVARSRTGPARDRIEKRPAEYQDRVRAGFLLAPADRSMYSSPLTVIDGGLEADAVFALIRKEVQDALALDPRP